MATTVIGVAAVVNGQPIPLAEYETQAGVAESYYSQQPDIDPESQAGKEELAQLRLQVLDWMIDQVLIEQAAIREGIQVPDTQVDAEVAKMRAEDATRFDQWLEANGLTLESFKRRLRVEMMGAALSERVTRTIPTRVEQVRVRHILLSTEQEAKRVLDQLESGVDFATLARTYSLDGSNADQGGDLGFFPRGLMAPEFEEAAFSLAPGEVSGVIKTQFGYHVIEVLEYDPDRDVPAEILPALRQQAFQRWLESERALATIEIFLE
jgi:foldase protein PrsA